MSEFSVREAQLLKLADGGYTNAAIASLLGISEATVNTYWNRIRSKVGHRSRTEILLALRDQPTPESRPGWVRDHIFGIAHVAADGRFLWVNRHWSRIFGGEEDEWVRKSTALLEAQIGAKLDYGHDTSDHADSRPEKTLTLDVEFDSPLARDLTVRITCSTIRIQPHNQRGLMICAEPVEAPHSRRSPDLAAANSIGDDYFGFILDRLGRVVACEHSALTELSIDLAEREQRSLWDILAIPLERPVIEAAFQIAIERHQATSVIADIRSAIGVTPCASWWFSPLSGRGFAFDIVMCVLGQRTGSDHDRTLPKPRKELVC